MKHGHSPVWQLGADESTYLPCWELGAFLDSNNEIINIGLSILLYVICVQSRSESGKKRRGKQSLKCY